MNHTAKNIVRFAGVVIGLGAAAWALRDKLLPAPEIHDEPPPRFREPGVAVAESGSSSRTDDEDDLTTIKGIGPVTAGKLADAGVTTFKSLAAADANAVSEIAGTSETASAQWITAASQLG